MNWRIAPLSVPLSDVYGGARGSIMGPGYQAIRGTPFVAPPPIQPGNYRNIQTGALVSHEQLRDMLIKAGRSTDSPMQNEREIANVLKVHRLELVGGVRPPDYGLTTPRTNATPPTMIFERGAPALCECPTQFPPAVPEKVVGDMVAAINARTSDAWRDMIAGILKKYLEGVVQGTILWRLVMDRRMAEREALGRAGEILQTPPAIPIPVPAEQTVIAVFEATPLQDGMSQQAAEQAVLSALPSDLRSRWVGTGVEIANTPAEVSRVFDIADSIMRSSDILVGVRIVSQPPRMSLPAPMPSPVAPGIANCPDCTPWFPA